MIKLQRGVSENRADKRCGPTIVSNRPIRILAENPGVCEIYMVVEIITPNKTGNVLRNPLAAWTIGLSARLPVRETFDVKA